MVQVTTTSLNRGEISRIGNGPAGQRPGWDIVGVVEQEAARGTGPAVGSTVVELVNGGAWAERVAVPVDYIAPVPEGV